MRERTLTNFSFANRMTPEEIETLERFSGEIPVRVGALADALGLRVVVATLPMNISGLIAPDAGGGYVIKVNRFEPKERQRFTIAHEIAHYLLHRERISAGVVDSVLYRSKLSSRAEAEANRLAADIIMPLPAVRDRLNNLYHLPSDDRTARLAEMFQVSRSAMEIRTG